MAAEDTLEELLRAKYEPIAIVGMGLRLPGGNDTPAEFAAFLRAGGSALGDIPEDRAHLDAGRVRGGFLEHVDRFDAAFFNISPKEAVYVDPHQRLMLEAAWQALEHAGIDPTGLRHSDTGVYAGVTTLDYIFESAELASADVDGYLAPGLSHSAVSGRLSYFLGLRGPSVSVDTTCSSSLAATHLAVQALRAGECGLALCGGVNVIANALGHRALRSGGVLAGDGRCKTFDERADGYARAEGAGVVVLKRLSDATRDGDTVHAVIRGSAIGQDGESAGLTAPNGAAQEQVMRAALARCRLTPSDIQYIEAHGTGTALGDPIEIRAIGEVFADSHTKAEPIVVASLKTNLGHMEGAAGIGGIIKAVLQLRDGTIYPHLNMTTPSSRIAWDELPVTVPTECRPWPAADTRRALVNGFGITGTIVSVVMEEAAKTPARPSTTDGGLFTLSAKSSAALTGLANRYREHLEHDATVNIADLCRVTNTGRTHFRHRFAGLAHDRGDLVRLLDRRLAAGATVRPTKRVPKIAFLFSGGGTQYPGMGAALYRQHRVFREALDECDQLFAPFVQTSVKDLMLGTATQPELLNQASYSQPALFSFGYALARLWRSWGVRPAVLIGHSLGELIAATVAGLFSLPDAARVVAERGRLSESAVAGATAAARLPASEMAPLLTEYPDLWIGADNGPTQCLVTGGVESLTHLGRVLVERGVKFRRLPGGVPYHSPLLDGVLEDFREILETVDFQPLTMPVISNVTGRVARFPELATADYWVRQLSSPVLFADGVHTVQDRGTHAFIELGPLTALTALARTCADDGEHTWLSSTFRDDADGDMIRRSLATLYETGAAISWPGYHRDSPRNNVDLPTYPFERRPYWLPTPRRIEADERRAAMADDEAAPVGVYQERWLEQLARSGGGHSASRRILLVRAPETLRDVRPGADVVTAEDAAEVLSALRAAPVTDLCWFWRDGAGSPQAECEHNYRALLDLLRTITEESLDVGRLWLVTECAQRLPGDTSDTRVPAAATLWGFGRSLSVEHPSYRTTLLDLPAGASAAALAELLGADHTERELASRAGRSWVRRIVAAEPSAAGPVRVRPDRTYVVAGGLGMTGMATARQLAELGAGHIVLLGRTVRPDTAVPHLGGQARVSVRRCDISDPEDVAAALASDPPVGGIVHAAGAAQDMPLSQLSWAALDAAFRPAVYGAQVLADAAAILPELEFFLLHSTATALLGTATQAAACAGGAFLDQVAATGLPALSIGWGPWAPVGPDRKLGASLVRSWRNQGITLVSQADVGAALPALLGSGHTRVLVGRCDWTRFAARRPGSALLTELVADALSGPRDLARLAAKGGSERDSEVNVLVRSCVAEVLHFDGPDEVAPDADLAVLGMDSLNAIEIRSVLEGRFQLALPPSVTFDHPNIDLLSEFINDQLPADAAV